MIDIATIHRQHQEILALAQQILQIHTPEAITAQAFPLSLLLGQLSGKLTLHLQHEDAYVYPRLNAAPDRHIQEISQRFAREMGGLVREFTAFKSKYLAASAIKQDPVAFQREVKRILSAVQERIRREEQQLYV